MTKNVVVCPNCDGKPVCNPFEQKQDRPCSMCNGRGVVNLTKFCECGRPAVMVVADRVICTTLGCHKEAIEAQAKGSAVKAPVVSDDDLQAAVEGMLADGWLGL